MAFLETPVRYRSKSPGADPSTSTPLLTVFLVGVTLLSGLASGCARPNAATGSEHHDAETVREIGNLEAFARLYGYVRYFHPTDAAADLDWDRFAIHAIPQVRAARTTDELGETLRDLFDPVTNGMQLYRGTLVSPPSNPAGERSTATVAWQHVGVDLAATGAPYRSLRTNRTGYDVLRRSTTQLRTVLDARPLRGMDIRLTVAARAAVQGVWRNRGLLWFTVEREGGSNGAQGDNREHPIMSRAWTAFQVEGRIDDDATSLSLGARLIGTGKIWVDDVILEGRRPGRDWHRVEVPNPGFEEARSGSAIPGWSAGPDGATVIRDTEAPNRGRYSALIEYRRDTLRGPLFEERPTPGEVIDKQLIDDLRCRLPVALDSARAAPPQGDRRLERLTEALQAMDVATLSGNDVEARLADVIIAWNVLQHFFPYFDLAEVDWEAELRRVLVEAMQDTDEHPFHGTLRRMVEKLRDSHAHAFWLNAPPIGYPPVLIDWVEGRLVVTASGSPEVAPGDVILSIDGVKAKIVLEQREAEVSGSPQWKRQWVLMYEIGTGAPGSTVEFDVDGPSGRRTVQLQRTPSQNLSEPRPAKFAELAPGVVYVDLTSTPMGEIRSHMDELVAARGIVFDVRGYPLGNHRILQHLLSSPDTSNSWLRVPQIIYPDRERPAGFQLHGWNLTPAEPHLTARTVFLTDARAISYAEGLLSFVAHYRLGEIVGSPTAGANGNINTLNLAGGYKVVFGGMVVVNHDGSRFHGVGIRPTSPMARTVAGIRTGRDELLERAVAILTSD